MPTVQTSIDTYFSIMGDLPKRRKNVYAAIARLGRCSDADIQKELGWPINCVTPRRLELEKENLISFDGYKCNNHGRKVHAYRITQE